MSSNYIVSARKYRPSTFRSVVGQSSLTHTLKNAIASGRLAHAYLFCGPRGVGKTTCARIFAKTINCTNPTAEGEACNECESCRAFNEQRSYNITELDAASNNSVDNIRDLTYQVRIPPQTGRYRVFIIDEVHMLSAAAFNAFLKTLEEPPEYAIFILATTEKQKVIPTILSRCQIYDFTRITVPDIVQQLQYICAEEGIQAEPAALNVIAQKADGALRDALSIFDQVAASSDNNITYRSAIDNLNVLDYEYYFRLVEAFLAVDVPTALLIYKEIRDKGFDSLFFVNGLAQHLRDLMVASSPQTRDLLEMNEEARERYVVQAAQLNSAFYYRALDLCNRCDLDYRTVTNKQLSVELLLIKLCQIVAPTAAPNPNQGGGALRKIEAAPAARPQTHRPAKEVAPTPPAEAAAIPAEQTPAPAPQPVVVAPATTPTMASSPRAPYGSSRVMLTPSLRISGKREEDETAKSAESSTVVGGRREPFTPEQLLEAWQRYIDEHPKEPILITTMHMSKPRRVSDTVYELEVENQGQVSFIKGSTELITALRNAVNNDMLALEVRVSKDMSDHRIWSPREVANDMMSRNPHFEKFLKDFDLSLA